MARRFLGVDPGLKIGDLPVYPGYQDALQTPTDTTNFDGNLNSSHDTVQKALDALDDVVGSGGTVYNCCCIDGGRANEIYPASCSFDGGYANATFSDACTFDGGSA